MKPRGFFADVIDPRPKFVSCIRMESTTGKDACVRDRDREIRIRMTFCPIRDALSPKVTDANKASRLQNMYLIRNSTLHCLACLTPNLLNLVKRTVSTLGENGGTSFI